MNYKKFQIHNRCKTAIVPLPGGAGADFEKYRKLVPSQIFESLVNRYGSHAELIFQKIAENPKLSEPILPDFQICRAELEFSIESEHTQNVEDFLFRRTRIGLFSPEKVDLISPIIAKIISK